MTHHLVQCSYYQDDGRSPKETTRRLYARIALLEAALAAEKAKKRDTTIEKLTAELNNTLVVRLVLYIYASFTDNRSSRPPAFVHIECLEHTIP